MTSPPKSAILLLAHGSPDRVEEVPDFLLQVTGGRSLPEQIINEVKHRYSLIGASPLRRWTQQQADQLANEIRLPVYVGMRNWTPFIPDTARAMAADGIQRAVVICMAPQNSRTSVGLYRQALMAEQGVPFEVDFIESWHDHPLLIKAFVDKLRARWESACREMSTKIPIIFTAHSVPQRTVAEGDPYEAQSKETAELIAREASLDPNQWMFAFQSQGMSGGKWLGPTVEGTIRGLKAQGHCGVFIQPIGFLCDHVEVLYDIDIGFRQFAEKESVRLWRAESLNGSPTLTAALADIARSRLQTATRN